MESSQETSEAASGGASDELKKGLWTAEEDAVLALCVQRFKEGNWSTIALKSGLNRSGKSCRLRWVKHLSPAIRSGPLTEEEQRKVIELQSIHGNKWALMASMLPGRSDNTIKNFWNSHRKRAMRRQSVHSGEGPRQVKEERERSEREAGGGWRGGGGGGGSVSVTETFGCSTEIGSGKEREKRERERDLERERERWKRATRVAGTPVCTSKSMTCESNDGARPTTFVNFEAAVMDTGSSMVTVRPPGGSSSSPTPSPSLSPSPLVNCKTEPLPLQASATISHGCQAPPPALAGGVVTARVGEKAVTVAAMAPFQESQEVNLRCRLAEEEGPEIRKQRHLQEARRVWEQILASPTGMCSALRECMPSDLMAACFTKGGENPNGVSATRNITALSPLNPMFTTLCSQGAIQGSGLGGENGSPDFVGQFTSEDSTQDLVTQECPYTSWLHDMAVSTVDEVSVPLNDPTCMLISPMPHASHMASSTHHSHLHMLPVVDQSQQQSLFLGPEVSMAMDQYLVQSPVALDDIESQSREAEQENHHISNEPRKVVTEETPKKTSSPSQEGGAATSTFHGAAVQLQSVQRNGQRNCHSNKPMYVKVERPYLRAVEFSNDVGLPDLGRSLATPEPIYGRPLESPNLAALLASPRFDAVSWILDNARSVLSPQALEMH